MNFECNRFEISTKVGDFKFHENNFLNILSNKSPKRQQPDIKAALAALIFPLMLDNGEEGVEIVVKQNCMSAIQTRYLLCGFFVMFTLISTFISLLMSTCTS